LATRALTTLLTIFFALIIAFFVIGERIGRFGGFFGPLAFAVLFFFTVTPFN
jgi:hypothetical protein